MRPLAQAGTRGGAFWLLVLASAAGHVVNGATTPVVSRLAQAELGSSPAVAGLLVSLAGFASIAVMPVAGTLTDRFGPRGVLIAASAVGSAGLATVLVVLSTPALAAGRVAFGVGNAAVVTALTAWVVAETPPSERGRALGLFGLSVWVGLALGPVLGENLYRELGHRAVWTAALALQVVALVVALVADRGPAPRRSRPTRSRGAGAVDVVRAVGRPGIAGLVAWSGEGFLIAFLLPHLLGRGLESQGLFGAANVFPIFAGSVIGVRLLLGSLPDRLGPTVTARIGLVVLAAGFGVLAVAADFGTAAIGAVLVGAGYSPLFPSLTMLATRRLPESQRGAGVGAFSAFTSAGYAIGSLLGGVLMTGLGSSATLGILAVLQLAVLPLLRRPR